MAAFVKFSVLFAVVASAYAAPQVVYSPPRPYGHPLGYHHDVVPVVHQHVVPHVVPHVGPHVDVRSGPFVPINSQSFDLSPEGAYTFQYESADGSSRQESGTPQYKTQDGLGGVAVQGRYAYASPEGPVQVEYIADENGYQPSGPNVHPEIQKAVAAQVAQARSEGPIYGPGPAPAHLDYHVHPVVHAGPHPIVHSVPVAYPTPYPTAYPSSTFKA